jgi:SSS family solute:Na+ symporter
VITLGGMKVIGYTDVIQVLVLLAGGLITSYIALTVVSEQVWIWKRFSRWFQSFT